MKRARPIPALDALVTGPRRASILNVNTGVNDMPYVQVWVEDCDGDCDSSAKVNALKEMIEEAVELLEEGRAAEALELLTQPSARPAEVKAEYAAIQAGKSPWFRLYSQSIASGGLQ